MRGHVLGLATAGGVTAWRLLRPVETAERGQVAGGAALLAAPLVAGGIRLARRPSTFSQPELQLESWMDLVRQCAGPEAWLVMVVGVMGLVVSARAPRAGGGDCFMFPPVKSHLPGRPGSGQTAWGWAERGWAAWG